MFGSILKAGSRKEGVGYFFCYFISYIHIHTRTHIFLIENGKPEKILKYCVVFVVMVGWRRCCTSIHPVSQPFIVSSKINNYNNDTKIAPPTNRTTCTLSKHVLVKSVFLLLLLLLDGFLSWRFICRMCVCVGPPTKGTPLHLTWHETGIIRFKFRNDKYRDDVQEQRTVFSHCS